ncbi:hypothetical protein [Paenibacillus sp. KN14-4R]
MLDAKTGLIDYAARWYSASNGRFTTQDTFKGKVIVVPSASGVKTAYPIP